MRNLGRLPAGTSESEPITTCSKEGANQLRMGCSFPQTVYPGGPPYCPSERAAPLPRLRSETCNSCKRLRAPSPDWLECRMLTSEGGTPTCGDLWKPYCRFVENMQIPDMIERSLHAPFDYFIPDQIRQHLLSCVCLANPAHRSLQLYFSISASILMIICTNT